VPHVRLETPQDRPEVPNDPGEVSHVLQEPGNDRRETVFNEQLKVVLRGSEKKATNIPRRGFRCGSDCTGLFLAAGGEKKSEGSMKLLEGALNLTYWSEVYDLKDVDAVL
jgi:hypothetical protein